MDMKDWKPSSRGRNGARRKTRTRNTSTKTKMSTVGFLPSLCLVIILLPSNLSSALLPNSIGNHQPHAWGRRGSVGSGCCQYPHPPQHSSSSRLRPLHSLQLHAEESKSPSAISSSASSGFLSSTESLGQAANALLMVDDDYVSNIDRDSLGNNPREEASTRRLFFASSLIAAGTALSATAVVAPDAANAASLAAKNAAVSRNSKLQWEVTPVNKRTGVTVFDAEQSGYNIRFVTYLSRFLLSFDQDCQRWWYNRAGDIPRMATAIQVNELRLAQFAAFSASVEVGLQEYRSIPDGPKTLLRALLKRYCPETSELQQQQTDMTSDQLQKQEREIREARRQIALLFALMETNQPVEEITTLLAAIDNGSIASVRIKDPGSGYAPGYGSPQVTFPPPEAGPNFETATGRAILSPNGKLLRIDLVNRGFGYSKAPTVTISPPAAIRFGEDLLAMETTRTSEAKAYIFRSGPNKGRLERIQLTKPGLGYTPFEIVRIRIAEPDTPPQDGGVTATAAAVLEYEVSDIRIVTNGTGYAVEKPIPVFVDPPPLTARVNMNDPMIARAISPDQLLPPTTTPTKEMLKTMPSPKDSAERLQVLYDQASGNKGGAGGCTGRACYDRPVVALAYPRAEKDSYWAYRSKDDELSIQRVESALDIRSAASAIDDDDDTMPARVVSASTSGGSTDASGPSGLPEYVNFAGDGKSSSSQLLSLLPAGVGLEFNSKEGRYQLASDPSVLMLSGDSGVARQWLAERQTGGSSGSGSSSSGRALDPDFGPRGRSPVEREMEIGVATYLRFVASGAICCSGVHLALTPIDVVKTKVQTDPQNYPGVVRGFQRIWKQQGLEGFFKGWAPTFLGFFVWGGVSYAFTEFLRRAFTDYAGIDAARLEVPIILLASGVASFFGSFILCPFEAVRIRSVAQPDFAPNVVQVFKRIVEEEGLPSLFSAVPAFLLKEVPFAMAKFTVFDTSTAWLYDQFPVATEDLQLSLLVSLTGGTLGGLVAAIVSNPADVTISEMKKAKNDMGARQAAQVVLDRGGPPALFTGLPLRLVFYALIVSLQFLVYDSVRIALGVGKDDLKLYLDVLGGALSESGGPI